MKSKKIVTIIAILMLSALPHTVKAASVKYTVQSGDTLWKISQKFKTTISQIASSNSLDVNKYLYIGQTLLINDNSEPSYIKHTVSSGESLWKISVKYSTTISEIKTINNLTNDMLLIGQVLNIPTKSVSNNTSNETNSVQSVNYKVNSGDTLWGIAQKYNTSMYAIKVSNMLHSDNLMPNQIITVPVNSTQIVKPKGIVMMKPKANGNYGDLYDWENGRRLFTVGTTGTLKDLKTGISFNIKYYGGSNHSDIVPITKSDTEKMKKLFPTWSWNSKRPMILYFNQNNTNYQMAVSLTGMPHSTTDIYNNGVNGHFDLYFYNSTSHVDNKLSQQHQNNVLTANGQ